MESSLNLSIYELKTQDICTCAASAHTYPERRRHKRTAVGPLKEEKAGNAQKSLVLNNSGNLARQVWAVSVLGWARE